MKLHPRSIGLPLALVLAYERASQKRAPPKSVPHLDGEVFTYERKKP